jgi:hypothetical protein
MSAVYKQRPVPEWTLRMHWAFTNQHVAAYRDDDLKVQMQVSTAKTLSGKFKEQVTTYHLDGDVRVFETEDELLDALMSSPAELWVHAGSTRQKGAQ